MNSECTICRGWNCTPENPHVLGFCAPRYSIRPFGRYPRFEILRNGELIGDTWGESNATKATHEDAAKRKDARLRKIRAAVARARSQR